MLAFSIMLLRLSLAIVLGALIGLEREIRNHEAGLRTNALVAFGCALFTIISGYGFLSFLGIAHMQIDPTRIASYIVAGIGFLGAGTIFRRSEQDRVKGLTTAAAIWVVAAIGMACGVGLLWEAAVATLLALLVLFVLHYVEPLLVSRQLKNLSILQIEMASTTVNPTEAIYVVCSQYSVKVERAEVHNTQENVQITLHCKLHKSSAAQLMDALRALPGCQTINMMAE